MGVNRPTYMWDLARAVVGTRDCPDCKQPKGERCVNLRDNARPPIALPHVARYPGPNRNIGDPENTALLGSWTD
jgi:hypothetical protein